MAAPETCPECGSSLVNYNEDESFGHYKCGAVYHNGELDDSDMCELIVAARQRDLLLELLLDERRRNIDIASECESVDPIGYAAATSRVSAVEYILAEYEKRKDKVDGK